MAQAAEGRAGRSCGRDIPNTRRGSRGTTFAGELAAAAMKSSAGGVPASGGDRDHGVARMDWLDFREPVSAWTHCAWALLSVPATLLLWARSRGNAVKRLGLVIFGISLTACYGASTLFHAVRL